MMRPMTRSMSLALLLTSGICFSVPAHADMNSDCERHGIAFSKKQGSTLTRIQIERGQFPVENRYDDKVGSQFVSTELMGMAKVTSADGTKRMRYVCLHNGKKAVYLGLID